jgi:7-dehydrocholesterol reductase
MDDELRARAPASPLRRWIGPLALLVATPLLAITAWMIAARHEGSVALFARSIDLERFVALLPRPTPRAAAIVGGWIATQWALLRFLPGRVEHGPITASGARPAYRANGLAAWAVTHLLLVGGWAAGAFSATAVVRELGAMLVVLHGIAIALCFALYARGVRNAATQADSVHTGHLLFDFFQGIERHPRALGVPLKQLVNCRVSMMGWSALVLCLAGSQIEARGALTSGMAVSAGLLVLYLLKFFAWETGYFASLDVMHDRCGYYLFWGVLVWVPAVYTLPAQFLAARGGEIPLPAAVAIAGVGLLALGANYAADAQRQRVRRTGGETTVWGRAPRTIVARYRTSDGAERSNLLLASGWWGLARHFHYLPELVVALAWAAPAGTTHALPYVYPAFLAILLVDRASRDDARCRAKYGSAWDEYCRLVPAKIVPAVY